MKRWYIVHAYSGYEKQVLRSLKDRIARSTVVDSFGEVLVPTEEVVEMKGGKKRKSERKFFPGYVLVETEMNDNLFADEIRKLQMLEGRLQKTIKEFLGVSAKVRLMEPRSIERSEGKAKRIVDNRPKD